MKEKESPTMKNDDLKPTSKLQIHDEFMIMLIDRDVTTLTTTLNRVNHFRYLIFMGNCNGVISYGKGKKIKNNKFSKVKEKILKKL